MIGASWAAYFLAQGLDVAATDPAPGAEAALGRAVEMHWPVLERLGFRPARHLTRLRFSTSLEATLEGAQFVQETGRSAPTEQELYRRMDAADRERCAAREQFLHHGRQRDANGLHARRATWCSATRSIRRT